MLLQIGAEAVGDIPHHLAKRLEGRHIDEAVQKAVRDETMAALMRMQRVAMQFGFLIPDAD